MARIVSNLIILATFALSIIGAASAAETNGGEQDFSKSLVAAKEAFLRVGFYNSTNPDCSVLPGTQGRAAVLPTRGSLVIRPGVGHRIFTSQDNREPCSRKLLRGIVVYYRPARGYVGPDTFVYDVFFPKGGMFHTNVSIDVR